MTLSELEMYMANENLKYSVADDYIRTSFATDQYRDKDGDHSIFLVIRLEEQGEYFKMMAPNLYRYPPEGPGAGELYRTLLSVSWRTKLIKFEVDEADGEIRAVIEFPLEDGQMSAKQFLRCLNGLVQLVDEYHPAIALAMNGQRPSMELVEDRAMNTRLAEELRRAAGIEESPEPPSAADIVLED